MNRTEPYYEDKPIRRTNFNKLRTSTLYQDTGWSIQLTKQSKLKKKSEWFSRTTISTWITNHKRKQRNNNVNISKQCYKCGNQYNQNHLQSCPAKDKICSKCAKRSHFAKLANPQALTI